VAEQVRGMLVDGDLEQLAKIYTRIERYMSIIAGADFIKFESL
jgi:hypothetical protein